MVQPLKRKSWYTKLCARYLFPWHESLKKHKTGSYIERLEQSQWHDPARIQSQQIQRLKHFLVEIGNQVPYYKTLFETLNFDPSKVSDLSDLEALPFLTKSVIRENFTTLKSVMPGPLTAYNTGGSSGEPLQFMMGIDRKSHDVAAKWRATRWWGVDIGDPEIVLWGSPIELSRQDYIRQARDTVFRSKLLPAFDLKSEHVKDMLDKIRSHKTKMLFGYPSVLAWLAEEATAQGLTGSDIGIQVAFVTSERLYETQRQAIEQFFACPVANGYGGRDAGFIAHECPEGSLHISAEDIIVEIVDEDGTVLPPGKTGEIVVTHLGTRDFPFVRYKTGDVGALSDKLCSCGRGLPVLAEIQGRHTDFVVAADGTKMHGLALIYILRELEGVKTFKITQQSLELTQVQLVVSDSFNQAVLTKVEQDFKARLGADVQVDVQLVDQINSEKSGKYRYVVSHVLTH